VDTVAIAIANASNRIVTSVAVLCVVVVCVVVLGCNGSFGPFGVGGDERDAMAAASAAALGSQANCLPTFPDHDGWLGGDVAASIPVPGRARRRSVWLFGDSFVAPPGTPTQRRFPFVHNAIGLSRCDESGVWSIDFAWGSESPEHEGSPGVAPPRAFFEPDPTAPWAARVRRETGEAPYYWPISGAFVEGTLFVALLRVTPAPARGALQLPFRPIGVDLARIEDTTGPPETWRVRYSTLSERADVLPSVSLVAGRDHLFAFADLDRGDGREPRILIRLPSAALDHWQADLEPYIETLERDGAWHPGLDPDSARILMDDDATEMSVHFDPGLGRWLAVYSDPTVDDARRDERDSNATGEPPSDADSHEDPGGRPADAIWLRHASRIEGPWSAPRAIFRIPELAAGEDPPPGEPFCYAGKAHSEYARSGRLLVTYVCNLWSEREDEVPAVLERLRTTPSLYRPQVVRLAVPTD
jgi:hypothetical protein